MRDINNPRDYRTIQAERCTADLANYGDSQKIASNSGLGQSSWKFGSHCPKCGGAVNVRLGKCTQCEWEYKP